MFNKVYKKVRQILKENKGFFIVLLIILLLSYVRLPYYINAPGGLVNLDTKVVIDGESKSSGSLNMAYVSEYRASVLMLIYAYLNPNFDIYKASDYIATGETYETMNYREDLELKEATDNAIIVGYTKAGKEVNITSNKMYVTYIYDEANTDLEVKDQIVKIDDIEVNSRSDISNLLNNKNANDKIDIEVLNNNKTYHRYAYVLDINDVKMIGILITCDKTYEVDPSIQLKFKSNESGPSGGLMTSLEIYDELVSEDITKGYKIAGTGTIDEDGNVGSIGGVKYKLKGAVNKHASIFFVPAGDNYNEAIKEKEDNNYKIDIVSVATFDDALNYLNNLTK